MRFYAWGVVTSVFYASGILASWFDASGIYASGILASESGEMESGKTLYKK